LSVHKGQKVRCLNTNGQWACVVSEDNKRGYIPSNILKMPTKTEMPYLSKPLPYSPSKQTISDESISVRETISFVIMRRKISLSKLDFPASVDPIISSEIEQPDTNSEAVNLERPDTNSEAVNLERPDTNSEAVNPERPARD